MRELIKHIAQALVDNQDEVDVQEIKAQQTLVLELRVAKEDLGKVIGKKGRTAQAMRTILSCASAKQQKRVILEIVEYFLLSFCDGGAALKACYNKNASAEQ